jgi:exopolysaccharide biosynthesis protein
MHKFFITLFVAVPVFLWTGCSRDYDDSALWNDIDKMWGSMDSLQRRIGDINAQADMLSQIANGSVITSITQNQDGDCVVTYRDDSNVEQTVVIATDADIVQVPVIGVKLDEGVYYWTSTAGAGTSWILDANGEKIPLGGKTPVIGIDNEGYWTVNGARIKDNNGNDIKAERKNTSLILDIRQDSDGNAVITLGNGTQITAQLFDAFNLAFEINTQRLTDAKHPVTDPAQPITVNYTVTGKNAADAMVDIVKCTGLSASLDATNRRITVTFPAGFEEGILMVMIFDLKNNIIIKPILFSTNLNQGSGISTAGDLAAFAQAVNEGRSIARFRDASGAVVLNNDIDMSGITSWTPIGKVIPSTANANTAVTYTPENAFDGIFDGKGFSIINIQWSFDVADGNMAYGLFGAIDGATIKNLTLGTAAGNSKITLTGTASQGVTAGSVAGYATSSILTNVRNHVDLTFAGSDGVNIMAGIGGIAGTVDGSTIGGTDAAGGVTNNGEITCGAIANTGNGANGGMHVAGICAVMNANTANLLNNCINNGNISAPSGRSGGLVAVGAAGTVTCCTNNGTIQDDINGVFATHATPYDRKRMGGLVGGTAANFTLSDCTNNGNVFSQLGCRTGGFVGHNVSPILNCTNNGIILSDLIDVNGNKHGAGWACGYNDNASRIKDCTMGGKVGDYSLYKDAPQTAPDATYGRAVCHGAFSAADNGLTSDMDAYYEWTTVQESTLHTGVKYYKYAFTNISRNIYVLEIDRSNPNVEITTVVSNDLIPNPNGNNNVNNGQNLRETLSETCVRKREAGENIIAGINTGYFDSNEGIPRGFHIQDGEAYYINNPAVRTQLANHKWGFTVFEDRGVSFDTRTFSGVLQVDGVDYEYYSINDTITRLTAPASYDANLYTRRLQKTPHASRPDLTNSIGTNALFIVGTNDSPMLVNKGFVNATITGIIDGRPGGIAEAPYVSAGNQWVLQVTGTKAAALAAALSTGKSVKIRSDVYLNSNTSTPPIVTHNSSMYRFLQNGAWSNPNSSNNPNSSDVNAPYPSTVAGASQDGNTVYLVAVEGKTGSNATGLSYYELYRTGKKLGCYNMVRFDGGGSTTMWIYENGTGSVVNTVADSNGERSCLNYFHVRIKQ